MRKYRVLYSVLSQDRKPLPIAQLIESDTVRYNGETYQYEFVNGTAPNEVIVGFVPNQSVLSVTKEN